MKRFTRMSPAEFEIRKVRVVVCGIAVPNFAPGFITRHMKVPFRMNWFTGMNKL